MVGIIVWSTVQIRDGPPIDQSVCRKTVMLIRHRRVHPRGGDKEPERDVRRSPTSYGGYSLIRKSAEQLTRSHPYASFRTCLRMLVTGCEILRNIYSPSGHPPPVNRVKQAVGVKATQTSEKVYAGFNSRPAWLAQASKSDQLLTLQRTVLD